MNSLHPQAGGVEEKVKNVRSKNLQMNSNWTTYYIIAYKNPILDLEISGSIKGEAVRGEVVLGVPL